MQSRKKLLIFNMDDKKAALIRTLCGNMDVRLVKIFRPQYGESIGALAGIPTFQITNRPYCGEDLTQEMMIICGFRPDELDAFLNAYREAAIPPVWLKATLTPYNMAWSAAQLYKELDREHRQLHG